MNCGGGYHTPWRHKLALIKPFWQTFKRVFSSSSMVLYASIGLGFCVIAFMILFFHIG